MAAVSLARVLLDSGLLDVAWLGKATAIATEADVPMCHALTRWKLLEPRALAVALSRALQLPVVDVDGVVGPPCVPMQRQACHRLRVVPLGVAGGALTLGMTDPTDDDAVLQVETGLHLRVERVLIDDDSLERALRRMFPRPGDEIRAAPWGMPLVTSSEPSTTPARPPRPQSLPEAYPRHDTTPHPVGARSGPVIAAIPAAAAATTATTAVTAAGFVPVFSPADGVPVVHGEDSRSGSGGAERPILPRLDVQQEPDLFQLTPTGTPTPPRRPTDAPISISGFESDSSGVFTSNTIEMGELPQLTPAPTVQMELPPGLPTVQLGAPPLGVTDEAPTLQNDLLGVIRLLVAIDDGPLADALGASFSGRMKLLCIAPLLRAIEEAGLRRFDVVIAVDPGNSAPVQQQIAALAVRTKGGVTVVSSARDLARVPGVKGVVAPPAKAGGLPVLLERLLAERAHG